MKPKQLADQLDILIKETGKGNISWKLQIETTDDLSDDMKEKIPEEDGEYIIDECFVSYECTYQRKDFRLISYEHVMTKGDTTRMTALLFLPPEGLRYFDVAVLAPYAIDNNSMLSGRVHTLFQLLMDMHKNGSDKVRVSYIDPVSQNVL